MLSPPALHSYVILYMNRETFQEIRDDIWHILLHMHSFQDRLSRAAASSSTRHELASDLVALNAIAENIIIRVGRLADKRKDVRSIKNFCKSLKLSKESTDLAAEFQHKAEAVLEFRNNRIAHMKSGDLSSYPVNELPSSVLSAIETLIRLVDSFAGNPQGYLLKVGSQEKRVDLRASVIEGRRVEV